MNGSAYIEEFIALAGYLNSSGKVPVEKGYILIPRKMLDKLLDRNAYDTAENKLRIWKRLHWIDTDRDRYTKKICRNGEHTRVVKMDIDVYITLAFLFRNSPGK